MIPALIGTLLYCISPERPLFFGSVGVAASTYQIFSLFPGFFIAALAAIASMGNENLDVQIDDDRFSLEFTVEGNTEQDVISKRMFGLYLFSYLLVLSLVLVVVASVSVNLFSEPVISKYIGEKTILLSGSLTFSVLYLSWSVLINLLLGLYLLAEKIHDLG